MAWREERVGEREGKRKAEDNIVFSGTRERGVNQQMTRSF